jgi:transposase
LPAARRHILRFSASSRWPVASAVAIRLPLADRMYWGSLRRSTFSSATAANDSNPTIVVRKIDAALELYWLRGELAPHYSSMGRPSIDPELMIRMLVVGYVFAIRSERLLCREVQVNLAYRWFCNAMAVEAFNGLLKKYGRRAEVENPLLDEKSSNRS